MSFWKSLFGGSRAGSQAASEPRTIKQVEHKGFLIEAQPYPEAGQYQACGVISKEIGGERKQHRFVRADRFSTPDDAADFTIMKGRQIVDLEGERIFR
jgi:hypothetical protein